MYVSVRVGNQSKSLWSVCLSNEDGECEKIEYGPVLDDPGVTPISAGQLKAAEYIEQHFGVRE